MLNFFIILIFCVVVFYIYKSLRPDDNPPKREPVKSAPEPMSLYEELLAKLNLEELEAVKHKEAKRLENEVRMSIYNEANLWLLKPEIERLYSYSAKNLAEHYFATAELNLKDNQYRALINYNKAIDLVKNPQYFNNRGCLHHSLDNIEMAIDDYNQAILLNPNVGKYYYNRGGAYYAVSRSEEARRDWEKALDLGIKEAENLLRFYF